MSDDPGKGKKGSPPPVTPRQESGAGSLPSGGWTVLPGVTPELDFSVEAPVEAVQTPEEMGHDTSTPVPRASIGASVSQPWSDPSSSALDLDDETSAFLSDAGDSPLPAMGDDDADSALRALHAYSPNQGSSGRPTSDDDELEFVMVPDEEASRVVGFAEDGSVRTGHADDLDGDVVQPMGMFRKAGRRGESRAGASSPGEDEPNAQTAPGVTDAANDGAPTFEVLDDIGMEPLDAPASSDAGRDKNSDSVTHPPTVSHDAPELVSSAYAATSTEGTETRPVVDDALTTDEDDDAAMRTNESRGEDSMSEHETPVPPEIDADVDRERAEASDPDATNVDALVGEDAESVVDMAADTHAADLAADLDADLAADTHAADLDADLDADQASTSAVDMDLDAASTTDVASDVDEASTSGTGVPAEDPSSTSSASASHDRDAGSAEGFRRRPSSSRQTTIDGRYVASYGATEEPVAIFAPPLDGPVPAGQHTWLTRLDLFRTQTQGLARMKRWQQIAAVTAHAILHAPYATGGTRSALLLDLARVYRDRIGDVDRALEAFAALAKEDAANAEALSYRVQALGERGDWEGVCDAYLRAVEGTWDPGDRLTWTKECADIAWHRLGDLDRAAAAWEQLWRLGDAAEEATRELSRFYRLGERWDALAHFLEKQAEGLEGPSALVLLRELVEVRLSGAEDPSAAAPVLLRILAIRPGDPLASEQLASLYVRTQNWDALEELGGMSGPEIVPERVHRVADALLEAGRLDRAAAAYARLRDHDAADERAHARTLEILEAQGRFDELVQALESASERATEPTQRRDALLRAASICEDQLKDPARAIAVLERALHIEEDAGVIYQHLSRLYRLTGDADGLARALEGRYASESSAAERVATLRELALHASTALGDHERAERHWNAVLELDPTDLDARDHVIAIYERAAANKKLVDAVERQLLLVSDLERAEALVRRAATAREAMNSPTPVRVAAWERVLDFAPDDTAALDTLAAHHLESGDISRYAFRVEHRILIATDPDDRLARALELAAALRREGLTHRAAAVYEMVLRWHPVHATAVDALVDLYQANAQPRLAIGVLENAALHAEDLDAQRAFLRRALTVVDAEAYEERFARLRRLLALGGERAELLRELRATAESWGAWDEYVSLLAHMASEEPEAGPRLAHYVELAELAESRLDKASMAYGIIQAALLDGRGRESLVDELRRLAERTGRHEDLLSVLGTLCGIEVDASERRARIMERASILEQRVGDPTRAFRELRRLIDVDANDDAAFAELERLTQEHGFHRALDAVIQERIDRTSDLERRRDLMRQREALARGPIDAPHAAFHLAVARFRLDGEEPALRAALERDAAALHVWPWVLALMEGGRLAELGAAERGLYEDLSTAYATHVNDTRSAFDRAALAHLVDASPVALPRLRELGESTGRVAELVSVLRVSAARGADPHARIELLAATAEAGGSDPTLSDTVADLHRLILQHIAQQEEADAAVHARHLTSLDALIARDRDAGRVHDVRQRLATKIAYADDAAQRVAATMEIAAICEELEDHAAALSSYRSVLQLDPGHRDAFTSATRIVEAIDDPALRVELLRMKLGGADPAQAVAIRMEIASLQRERLNDTHAAIGTLSQLIAATGVESDGFEPLAALLRDASRDDELVALLVARADALRDQAAKLALLDEAMELAQRCMDKLPGSLYETTLRRLVELRPDDMAARTRLARIYRMEGRFEEWDSLQSTTGEMMTDPVARAELHVERARTLAHRLDNGEGADLIWRGLATDPEWGPHASLWRARRAAAREDWSAYCDARREAMATVSPEEQALVLCHLAEVMDERDGVAGDIAELYREARRLDGSCAPAIEALKGIGRRVKQLRPAAALLPEEGERELSLDARALRLVERAATARDPRERLDWARRAVATSPDVPKAWDVLADAYASLNERGAAYQARRDGLGAMRRAAPTPEGIATEEAARVFACALAAQQAGDEQRYAELVRTAYELDPTHLAAGAEVARSLAQQGSMGEARLLAERLLASGHDSLTHDELAHVYHARAVTHHEAGEDEAAMHDLRSAIERAPRFADALELLAEIESGRNNAATALGCMYRALMVRQDAEHRASLLYRIGILLEDGLAYPDEAGACFELAFQDGMESRDLLHRVFRHYQRAGELERGLAVVDTLLETATASDELATLWAARGQVFAARDAMEDDAIEAFDMALSYDPGCHEARDGLALVLERRGDWDQLLQILEAIAESATPDAKARALRKMAEVSAKELGDHARAESYLEASLAVVPSRAALTELLALRQNDPPSAARRMDLLARIVAFGPPWYAPCVEIGEALLASHTRHAWCLLSPLLMVRGADDAVKGKLRDMRREYERPPLLVPDARAHREIWASDVELNALRTLLAEVESIVEPPPAVIDAGEVVEVSLHSTIGRSFMAFAERLGLPSCSLHRASPLDEPVRVVATLKATQIYVRSEIFQQMARAEVGFVLGYAFELARPGARAIASTPAAERVELFAALWRVLGLAEDDRPALGAWQERLEAGLDEETRERLASMVPEPLRARPGRDVGAHYWGAVEQFATRFGLLAGADIYQVSRLLSRMDDDVEAPGVYGTVEQFDEYIASSDVLCDLLAFSATPTFGQLLHSATEVG